MVSIYNFTAKGKLHTSSAREEYEYRYWLVRTYNNHWRNNPFLSATLNIVLNVRIENQRVHGEYTYSHLAQVSYANRISGGGHYQGQNFCRLLGRDKKLAKELKAHREVFCSGLLMVRV